MIRTFTPAALLSLGLGVATVTASPAVRGLDARDTTRVLWRDPGSISAKDLYWGGGSAARAPKPPFVFVKEDTSGTKPKVDVTDAAGVAWRVKFAPPKPEDNEVHAEIAVSRIFWAFGFFVDEVYFEPAGRIERAGDLTRAAAVVASDGAFHVARFERQSGLEHRGVWNVEDNIFNGTRELSALKILTMLVGNWDARDTNTAILRVSLGGGRVEDRYLMSDLGTAFGRMHGGVLAKHSRWNLEDYRRSRFIHGVVLDRLEFGDPLMGHTLVSVPLEHARWFATLTAQLTPAQIRRAFEAAGAPPAEIDGFSGEVIKRFEALRVAVAARGATPHEP